MSEILNAARLIELSDGKYKVYVDNVEVTQHDLRRMIYDGYMKRFEGDGQIYGAVLAVRNLRPDPQSTEEVSE